MKKIIKNILCFLNIHDWYKKDGKNLLFCNNQCFNCGNFKPKS